jgi:V8-like Glu-specific endopeptidase
MRRREARDACGRPRRVFLPAMAASSVAAVAVLGTALATPAGHRAERPAGRLAAELSTAAGQPHGGQLTSPRARPFRGTQAVGALFTRSHGRLGDHFCTASVVHSRPGNLLITAAHCLTGRQVGGPDGIVFVPGFHDGKAPAGSWRITAVFADHAWSARQDPDDDVAFVRAGRAGSRLETATGADRLGIGRPPQQVRVIGYPDGAGRPVTCTARARAFGARQMVFDCDGYADGTSGGPFIARARSGAGRPTVIGVIGGYQQGGDSPDVSYSPRFLAAVAALYKTVSSGR